MKLGEIFNVYSEDRKLIEQYLYKNKGEYPVYSATLSEPYGYIDESKYDGKMILVVNYGNAGKTRCIDGQFNIGRNVCGLKPKKCFEQEINLEFMSIRLEKIFTTMLVQGNMGCISQDTIKNVEIEYPFPAIEYQNEVVGEYLKLNKIKDDLTGMLKRIDEVLEAI